MKACLFGSIETICNISEVECEAYNSVFDDLGLDWCWSGFLYQELSTVGSDEDRLRYIARLAGYQERDQPLLDKVLGRKKALLNERLAAGDVSLRPGVGRIVDDALRAGVKLGLITSLERATINVLDAALGDQLMLANFSIFIDQCAVAPTKAKDNARKSALVKLRCYPSNAISIESTITDVSEAVAAGVSCVATPSDFSADLRSWNALSCVSHLGDFQKPAVHLAGHDILVQGIVTLDALDELVSTSIAV